MFASMLIHWVCAVTPSVAGEAMLNVDEPLTWSSVFDAGFRPSHVRDGLDKCRQLNVHVKLKTSTSAEVLDLGIGDVEFSLRDGHLLHLLTFYGREYRSVAEVEEKSRVFWRMFGGKVTRKAEIGWFEVKSAISYSGRPIDPPEITRVVDDKNAVNHAKSGDASIFYNFHSANSRDKPMLEQLSVSLKSEEAMTAGRLKTKIEPPAGYEHVSLEPALAETALSPTATPDQPMRTLSSPTVGPAKSTPSPNQPSSEKATDESPSNFPWVWIIGAIHLLAVAGGILLKLRRK
jgi:hypothetical protein